MYDPTTDIGLQNGIPPINASDLQSGMPDQSASSMPQGNLLGQILSEYQNKQQAQNNGGGLIQQILSNRFQPTLGDTSRSITQTAQSYGAPDLFRPVTPEQTAQTRAMQELAPYTTGLNLQEQAAKAQYAAPLAQAELQKSQLANQYAGPNADAELALKKAQAAFYQAQSGSQFGAGNGSQQSGLNGDALLQALPPQIATQVKALAEGRMQFPGGFALKTPYWQQMLSAVSAYDPEFDAINYNSRNKTRADFTSGKSSQQINALNTVIGHLGQLQNAIGGLKNTASPLINSPKNWVNTNVMGDTGQSNFDAIKNSVAAELVRVWRGTGGAEADIQGRLSDLSDSKSPDQLNGVIKEIGDLLRSKIDASTDQYRQGMGVAGRDANFINPKAQQTLRSLGVDLGNPIPTAQGIQLNGPPPSMMPPSANDPLGIR